MISILLQNLLQIKFSLYDHIFLHLIICFGLFNVCLQVYVIAWYVFDYMFSVWFNTLCLITCFLWLHDIFLITWSLSDYIFSVWLHVMCKITCFFIRLYVLYLIIFSVSYYLLSFWLHAFFQITCSVYNYMYFVCVWLHFFVWLHVMCLITCSLSDYMICT